MARIERQPITMQSSVSGESSCSSPYNQAKARTLTPAAKSSEVRLRSVTIERFAEHGADPRAVFCADQFAEENCADADTVADVGAEKGLNKVKWSTEIII